MRSAAIVTVGSELVEGARIDTHTAEVARALAPFGFTVREAVSVGDDADALAQTFRRLAAVDELVIVTGGLGPTHDDVTREAAAAALDRPLHRSARLEALLAPAARRHKDARAAGMVLVQADVLDGAEVIDPTTGTAPGQVVATPAGVMALLPGPPAEMRPMLAEFLGRFERVHASPRELCFAGLGESDVQVRAQAALGEAPGIAFTVLAKPGDVRALLFDHGAGASALDAAARRVADAFPEECYSEAGESLAQVVVRAAREAGCTLA
ncbi:MAG: competence/damage-inducible protein A, partial [Actinobacteria bacterium]